MPPQFLREDYDPEKNYLVQGDVLNRQNQAIMGLQPGQADGGGRWGGFNTVVGAQPAIIGTAVITDASNTCDVDDDGAIKAPCKSVNKYKARFRTLNHDNQIWSEYDQEYNLDASGFWEGKTFGQKAVFGTQYLTDASKSPSSGVGFGTIPEFVEGDVVTCYLDTQRGWLIPIPGSFEDEISGEFQSNMEETVGTVAPMGDEVTVMFVLEVNTVDTVTWTPVSHVSFRMPDSATNDDSGKAKDWKDTRSGFAIFSANTSLLQGAFVRIRGVTTTNYDITTYRKQIQFVAAGRQGESTVTGITTDTGSVAGGLTEQLGWRTVAGTVGRWKDSPTFTHTGSGIFRIGYLDPVDGWIIRVNFAIGIQVEETSSSSSDSSQSSSQSSSSPSSQSSSSPSSNSSSTEAMSTSSPTSSSSEQMTTSSTEAMTTSSSEQMTTSSTSLNSSSSENFDCVDVVTSVTCVDGELEVVTCRLCFPKSVGMTTGPPGPTPRGCGV